MFLDTVIKKVLVVSSKQVYSIYTDYMAVSEMTKTLT